MKKKKPTSKPFCAMLRAGTQAGHTDPIMGLASGCRMICGMTLTMQWGKKGIILTLESRVTFGIACRMVGAESLPWQHAWETWISGRRRRKSSILQMSWYSCCCCCCLYQMGYYMALLKGRLWNARPSRSQPQQSVSAMSLAPVHWHACADAAVANTMWRCQVTTKASSSRALINNGGKRA